MKTDNVFLEKELLLGRLLRSKLVMRLHGLISVGLASLESDSPLPFLIGRDKVVNALIEVLGALTVRPGYDAVQQSIVAHAARMARLWNTFYQNFLALGEWRSMSASDIRAIGDRLIASYSEMGQVIHSFQPIIDDESEDSESWQRTREMLFAMIKDLAEKTDLRQSMNKTA
jgi:hypothetical protein